VRASFPASVALAVSRTVSPSLILVGISMVLIVGARLLIVTGIVSVVLAPSLSVMVTVTLWVPALVN
jgi:hypothetical protein